MPEIIKLMYKHPKIKKSRHRVIASLCVDVDGIDVIEHVSKQWINFCKKNIMNEDSNTDNFVDKFLDEFHEDPNNDDYWIHRYGTYYIYSE
jgi:hypothetical protein